MIVWCQECETNPAELGEPVQDRYGYLVRPRCIECFYREYPQRVLLGAQAATDYLWSLIGLPDPCPQLFDPADWLGTVEGWPWVIPDFSWPLEDHIIRSEN